MSWTNTNGDTIPGPTEGNDVYIGGNAGTPEGGVNALGGNDSLSGGAGFDVLFGGAGNDTLHGGAGYDSIQGGDNNDLITDSAGGGSLRGNAGDDTIAVTLAGAGSSSFTNIFGGTGNDLITATGTGMEFNGRNLPANILGDDGNDTIVASDANDPTLGTFGGDELHGGIGDDSLLGSLADNRIFADDLDERFSPAAGTDVVDAGAGNDLVLSYGGADTLEGGIGNDRATIIRSVATDLGFTVDGAGRLTSTEGLVATGFERFNITSGGGNDTIISGQGNDTLAGGAGNDSIAGDAGDDQILAGSGNDTLSGGAGNDTLNGGTDTDTADYSAETGGVTVTLNAGNDGTATGAEIGTDTLIDIENVIGGAGADSIASTAGTTANRFEGGAGNDTLRGGGGNDTLDGGTDTDTADYSAETGGVTVTLDDGNDGTATGATIGTDTLIDIENVIGGAGADSIVSTAGTTAYRFDGGAGNDTLRGGGGNDTLDGGAGNDTLDGGAAIDTADYSADTAGVTVELFAGDDGTATGAAIGADTLTDIENVVGGAGADSIASTAGTTANRFEGGAGNDVLRGGGGIDTLLGDGGRDTLEGGQGYDVIRGGDDADLITDTLDGGDLSGGAGDDTIDVTLAGTFVGLGTAARGGSGDDLVTATGTGIQTLFGRLSTSLYGDEGNDTLVASNTNDPIFGGDQLYGGTGDDSLVGSLGINIIEADEASEKASASAGTDVVDAGAGDDSVYSFGGADTLEGGIGNDLAFIQRAVTTDLGITIDGAGVLTSTEGLLATGFERFDIRLGAGNDTILGGGTTADRFEGGAGDDTLSGGGGNDTLLGGEGDDYVLGGAGDDSIVATPGRDTIEGQAGNDVIDTGEDDDLVIWRVGDGNDVIAMGSGNDTLDLEGWTGSDTDFWSVNAGGAGAIYTYDDGAGTVFTLTTSGVETVTCFAPGTRILTPRGEVPVETLRAGDLVVTPGRGAPLKPVRWVGHTRVDIARHRDKRKVAPVLIRAGALGTGVPARDLRVSPEHAFLLQGRLVPAHLLLNGTTITQELWHRTLTYWHVELEEHGVLVAEGALAESYFDDGNRHLFDNGVIALHVNFTAGREGGRYATLAFAPPVMDPNDPALARIRAVLPAAPRMARSG